MKKQIWFKAKCYGWGWYPSTWQGWIVLLVWAIIFTSAILMIEKNDHEIGKNFAVIFIATAILIYVCYRKGEKPSWRWGNRIVNKK